MRGRACASLLAPSGVTIRGDCPIPTISRITGLVRGWHRSRGYAVCEAALPIQQAFSRKRFVHLGDASLQSPVHSCTASGRARHECLSVDSVEGLAEWTDRAAPRVAQLEEANTILFPDGEDRVGMPLDDAHLRDVAVGPGRAAAPHQVPVSGRGQGREGERMGAEQKEQRHRV